MPNMILSRLRLKDLGEPKILLTFDKSIQRATLGKLIGSATNFVEYTDQKTSEKSEGLRGNFRCVPDDQEKYETKEAPVLWLPDAYHNLIADPLRKAKKADEFASVNFGFIVGVYRAENPAGYSWDFKPMGEFMGKNPLDELQEEFEKALLAAPAKIKQIAGGKK